MADGNLQQWLQYKQQGQFGTLPRDGDVLYALLTGQNTARSAAQALVEDVSSASVDPDSDRAWRAWQLVSAAFAELPQHHGALVDLWVAVAAIPPPDPENGSMNRLMRGFASQYRDEYDGLKTYCYLRQKHDVEPAVYLTGKGKLLNLLSALRS